MKPIEIHIEGYKIVISKDETIASEATEKREEKDGIVYVPTPTQPTTGEWWRYPFATWTANDVLNGTSTASDFHPVRDAMVGKKETDDKTVREDLLLR